MFDITQFTPEDQGYILSLFDYIRGQGVKINSQPGLIDGKSVVFDDSTKIMSFCHEGELGDVFTSIQEGHDLVKSWAENRVSFSGE